MRRPAMLLILTALALVAPAAHAAPDPAAGPDLAAIDAFVEDRMRRHGIPGIALAVVRGGEVIHARGFGTDGRGQRMTADTPMFIGSVSKSFTGLAVMQLVEQGRIDRDAAVRTYLPWFEVADPDASARITVGQLLGHASGLSDLRYIESLRLPDDATIEEGARDLRRAEPVAPPGSEFHYFNPNYAVLGHLVEVVSGQPYADYLREHVFEPLDMRRTFADPEAARAAGLARGHLQAFGVPVPREQPFRQHGLPAGYLMSTANDMAHYLIAMNGGGAFGDQRVLSRYAMIELHAPSGPGGFYANGWIVADHRGHRLVQHGGTNEAFKTEAMLLPDDDLALVLLANQSTLPMALFAYADLSTGLLDLLIGETPASPPFTMRTLGAVLGVAFLIQLAAITRDAARLPRWRERARGRPRWRAALAVVPHFVTAPVIAIAVIAALQAWMGRGISLRQALDGVPDLTLMLAVGFAADLALGGWKARALARDRGRVR
ncbi:MAG: serine hydrolase domain-containing protein, partial [Trueperaceae bacterium]